MNQLIFWNVVLQGNELGTKGSALLARCLHTNSTLHTLNLAQNTIRQVADFESPLVSNRFGGLQHLDLNGNGLEFARQNPLQRLVTFTNNMMGVERQRKPHILRSTKLKRSTSIVHWRDMVQRLATQSSSMRHAGLSLLLLGAANKGPVLL